MGPQVHIALPSWTLCHFCILMLSDFLLCFLIVILLNFTVRVGYYAAFEHTLSIPYHTVLQPNSVLCNDNNCLTAKKHDTGSPLFYWKKSRTFQDPRRNFPGPLRSPQMLTYKEKWGKTFTHTVQSMGMGKRCPPPQPTMGSGGASLAPPAGSGAEPRPKTVFSRTFPDLELQFPGLSRTKVIFQDFPGPGFFKKRNPGLSRRRGNPDETCS